MSIKSHPSPLNRHPPPPSSILRRIWWAAAPDRRSNEPTLAVTALESRLAEAEALLRTHSNPVNRRPQGLAYDSGLLKKVRAGRKQPTTRSPLTNRGTQQSACPGQAIKKELISFDHGEGEFFIKAANSSDERLPSLLVSAALN